MFKRITLAALLAASAAGAASYDVSLGGRTIGTIDHEPGRLLSVLDNTPMGVGDGRFEGVATRGADGVHYVGQSDERRIEVRIDAGRAQATDVTPASERTPLSDPAAAPAGVVDPVTGFGVLADADDCPGAFRIYDGRRAVELTPAGREVAQDVLSCRMDYRVIAGPGHVSPFRIKSMTLTAHYAPAQGRMRALARLDVRAGGFTLSLTPQ